MSMRKWTRYLLGGSWTVRVAFILLAMVLGLVAALVLTPYVMDWMLLGDLRDPAGAVRDKAMLRAEKAAATSPRALHRLNRALEEAEDDAFFLTLASVLRNAGKLDVPGRAPELFDRLRAVELEASSESGIREVLAMEAVRARRDNRYQRQLLARTLIDNEPIVRAAGATLAAMLGDDAALRRLLGDADPTVAATAALDAGLAGRRELMRDLAGVLDGSVAPAVRGSAAYALALLAPEEQGQRILDLLGRTNDAQLRDYLLHVATRLEASRLAAGAVVKSLIENVPAADLPSPMLLLAAGKLKVQAAEPLVRRTLGAAIQADPARPAGEDQVQAAIQAAGMLDLNVRDELNTICQKLWGPKWPLMLMAAARELGRQMDRPASTAATAPATRAATQAATAPAGPPAEGEAEPLLPLQTLRLAAVYSLRPPASQPDQVRPAVLATPMPSAAAAVALWLAEHAQAAGSSAATQPMLSDEFVRAVSAEATTLPGEYIAWHLAASGRAGAFELALRMLPPLEAPPSQRVYNDNERAAGAMLLALSARTPDQKRRALDRISQRLHGTASLPGEDNFIVANSYRCALAALGEPAQQEEALRLLELVEFPQRRTVTALAAAGRKEALDWVLWNPQIPPDQIDFLLVAKGLHEVFEGLAPSLPRIDLAAPLEVRLWQGQILRDAYVLGRDQVPVGPAR